MVGPSHGYYSSAAGRGCGSRCCQRNRHAKGLADGLNQGRNRGLIEGHTKGRTEGFVEGLIQGLIEGLTRGRTEEAARAVLKVLRARGIAVPEAIRERIMAQKDLERLERWVEKAAVAASVAEVLDEPN